SSARSTALWCGGIRQHRQSDQPRRKTEESAEPVRRARTIHFRRSSGGILSGVETFGARRNRNHGFEFAIPRAGRTARETTRAWYRLARYRDTDEPAGSEQLHRDDRASSGNEDRVSRGNCATDGIHRRPEADRIDRSTTQRRVSGVFAAGGG